MIRVLIVDDERRDRNIIKILLARQYAEQFSFLEAENGEQALVLLAEQDIDLILLDINMPGLSGIDVLHRLQYMPYVIILSAHDSFEYTREALRCGVRDYLLKPPLREELYRAIDLFISNADEKAEHLPSVKGQAKEVFTRDLALQLMYYGDSKKIKGLMDVLQIQSRFAVFGSFHCIMEKEQDSGYVLDELEEKLEALGVPYAANAYKKGFAVFLFCDSKTAPPQFAALFAALASHLEKNLCATAQVMVGAAAAVPGGYPQAFSQHMSELRTATRAAVLPVKQARQFAGDLPDHSQRDAVQKILEKIAADCSRSWSIETLAEEFHVNSFYLSHLFKEKTGTCFTDYLAQLRIGHAIFLMQTTNLNFSEIGERVGYSDPNYFSRVFKKQKRVGPREYFKAMELPQT